MGRRHFWFTVVPLERSEPGTDLWAMEHGYISMTPLRLDLTDDARLADVERSAPFDHVPAPEEPALEEVEEDE